MAKIEILGVWCESHKSHICACSFEWNKSLLQMDSTNNYLDRDALKSENLELMGSIYCCGWEIYDLKAENEKLKKDLEEAVRIAKDYHEKWHDANSEKCGCDDAQFLSRFPVENKKEDGNG